MRVGIKGGRRTSDGRGKADRRGVSTRAIYLKSIPLLYIMLLCLVILWVAGRTGVFARSATERIVTDEIERIETDISASGEDEATGVSRVIRLDVPSRLQYPELPTGCESVALTDVLLFMGFELETTEIADRWLPTSDEDFVNAFRGDPRSYDGHACMAPGIVRTASRYLEAHDSSLVATDRTGATFEELLTEVSGGNPVIVWCTIDLAEPGDAYDIAWQDGREYRLIPNTHTVVLSGYDIDEEVVYVSDPLVGTTTYDMEVFAVRYYETGAQAVVIS